MANFLILARAELGADRLDIAVAGARWGAWRRLLRGLIGSN